MLKKFVTLLLILPLLAFCGNKENKTPEPEQKEEILDGEIYAKAGPQVRNGDEILATNSLVEKFLSEVNYQDKTYNDNTKVLDYYGGFNGKAYNEKGEEDPNGLILTWKTAKYDKNPSGVWPNGDLPPKYSIRWRPNEEAGAMTLHLSDNTSWNQDIDIDAGAAYVNFTCLIPNAIYTYKVTSNENGSVIANGSFKTIGHIHQLSSCRNVRDLGGWKTLDGKTVKFRKLYRGGRMEEINKITGPTEVKSQGIGAELDLRNNDRLSKPPVKGLDFFAPGIEEGGKWMLTNGDENGNFGKQCFEFIVKCLRENKGVFFHCSLGRDRTGTLDILLLGLLGVREGDIAKAYEVTYFAPIGYSVSSSESASNPEPIFKNTRMAWAYSDVVPYFWELAGEGSFASGVEKYLLDVAGVDQKDIDDFRTMMLE